MIATTSRFFRRIAALMMLLTLCGNMSACAMDSWDTPSEVYLDKWHDAKPTLRTVQYCAGKNLYIMPYFPQGRYRSISASRRNIVDSVYFNFDFSTGQIKSTGDGKTDYVPAMMHLTHNSNPINVDGAVNCPHRPLETFLSQSNIYSEFKKLTAVGNRGIDLDGCINFPSNYVFCEVFGFIKLDEKVHGRNIVYFQCHFSKRAPEIFQSYRCDYFVKTKLGTASINVFYYHEKGYDFLTKAFLFDENKIYADAEMASVWMKRFEDTLVRVEK